MEDEFWHEIALGNMDSVEHECDIYCSVFSCFSNDQIGRSKRNLRYLFCVPVFTGIYVLLNFTQCLKLTLMLFSQLFCIGWIQSAVFFYDSAQNMSSLIIS